MKYIISSQCWYSRKETIDSLPTRVKKVMCVPCQSFENKLLFESKLPSDSEDYALLKDILYQRLTFDQRCVEGKLHAVVAGAYAAYLGRAVKQYGDVDVFVIAHNVNLTMDLLRLVQPLEMDLDRWRVVNEQIESYGQVISVKNFGKVQLIIKRQHCSECLCDFHLNAGFFGDFHHCTRWRLDVFEKFFLVRYMSLSGIWRDVISLETAITPRMRPARGHSRKRKNHSRLYPNKHINNVVDFGPPKLSQQALHVILKGEQPWIH